MTTFVLTRPENAKSAVKLGFPVTLEDDDIPSGSNVIRWGNGLTPDKRGWSLVLNKSSVLQVSTNKLEALRTLSRTVKTPEIYESGQTLPRGHRYVARPATHAEGSDFQIIDCRRESARLTADHATRFIEDTREYRVWFIRDKYLVAPRVPRRSEGQTPDDPCRSKWAYGDFVDIFPKLKEEMGKARLALPLDFGAVDVLWKDGEGWFFLEFNSAPSLDTPTILKHFQTHLKAILRENPAREVPVVVPDPENAPNRRQTRPSPTPVVTGETWQARYEAKLRAEVEAEKKRIQERIYGEL